MSKEVSGFKFEKKECKIEKNQSKSHFHNFFEMYYMIDGECRYFVENKVLDIKPNSIILIPRGVPHKTDYDCK